MATPQTERSRLVRPLKARQKIVLLGTGAYVLARAVRQLRRPARRLLLRAEDSALRARRPTGWIAILKATTSKWIADEGPRRGAALAYYAIFSIAPLLLILMAIVGMAFGDEAAYGLVGAQLEEFLGADRARMVEELVRSARGPASAKAGLAGTLALLTGAAAVVGELQASMSMMWGTAPSGGGLLKIVKTRLISMAFVLAMGFLLLVSLVAGSAVSALGKYIGNILPAPEAVLQAANYLLSFGTISLLFAMMFKFLPRARIPWSDVWIGAVATAAFFTIGNFLLGLYLGKGGPTSTYGAAGSILAVLAWSYYCAQILYFGAEFTRVYSSRGGRGAD